MGVLAEQLVDEEMFGEDDRYGTIKNGYYKRTPSEKKIASIRKEIAIAVKNGADINEARRLANLKYGKGWRQRGWAVNDTDQWTEEELKPFM